MSTTRRIVVGLVLAALAVGGFYAWAIVRAFTAPVQQLATPAEKKVEAKIEAQGEAQLEQIEQQAKKENREVDDAKGNELLDLARKRLLGD